jgi:hypothetical protein
VFKKKKKEKGKGRREKESDRDMACCRQESASDYEPVFFWEKLNSQRDR